MYKVFTIVALLFTSLSSFAIENLDELMQTKQIVEAKLWYDGIESSNVVSTTYIKNQQVLELPEELAIPLDMLEAEIN